MDGAPGFLGRVETGRTGIYGFPGLKIEARGTRHLWVDPSAGEKRSLAGLLLEAQGFYYFFIDAGGLVVLLVDDAEAAAVVPHGPADAVGFKGCSYIANPVHARLHIGVFAVGSELIADEGDAVRVCPGGGFVDEEADAVGVPLV